MNSESMSNHSSTKNFGKFQCKLRPVNVMTVFFGLHLLLGEKMDIYGRDDVCLVFTCFWAKEWTSADVMSFFCLHLLLGKKMDIYGRDDLFFWSSFALGRKNGNLRT